MQPTSTALTRPIGEGAVAGADCPLLTYCDDRTGERTELSAVALGEWAARTARLLHEGCGLATGDRAAVLLPPHWQTAAVLLGAWSIGVSVSFRPWATAGLAPPAGEPGGPLDALFVARHRLESWLEEVPPARHRFVLDLATAPHDAAAAASEKVAGARSGDAPAGYRDYLTEVGRYPGTLPAYGSIRGMDAASPDGTSYRQWGGLARDIAAARGLRAGDRVLVDVAEQEQPVIWLLAPLAAGASIVLCANLDRSTLDARTAAEGATHVF